MTNLKPCPFCKGDAKNTSHSSCDCCGKAFTGEVTCQKCGARVSHFNTEFEAIEAWNTRDGEK
jgi:Lar family restriction alleviation protein